jgi:hypothetical protein
MNADRLVARLERFPDALDAVVAGLAPDDWTWTPPDGGWSILDVVQHLVLEETDDFRARARSTLEDPTRPWPKIDPEGDLAATRARPRDPAELLARFRAERAASVAWLRGLVAPKWEDVYPHPARECPAGTFLASWPAHDARHLQQIAKRLHGLAARDGAPYSVDYAG